MTKKEWLKLTEKQRIEYAYDLGIYSCRGSRAGKSSDKLIMKLLQWIKDNNNN